MLSQLSSSLQFVKVQFMPQQAFIQFHCGLVLIKAPANEVGTALHEVLVSYMGQVEVHGANYAFPYHHFRGWNIPNNANYNHHHKLVNYSFRFIELCVYVLGAWTGRAFVKTRKKLLLVAWDF